VWTRYWTVDVPECEPAAPVAEEEPPPAPKPAPVPVAAEPRVVLETVVDFDFDRSELKPPAVDKLNALLDDMKRFDVRRIDIDGHTCLVGTDEYNQGLSERRAEAVRHYMIFKGIDGGMLTTRGYGESRPKYDNADLTLRCRNRRAEVRILAIE
jgi:OOP family OmpA-OmpF porin